MQAVPLSKQCSLSSVLSMNLLGGGVGGGYLRAPGRSGGKKPPVWIAVGWTSLNRSTVWRHQRQLSIFWTCFSSQYPARFHKKESRIPKSLYMQEGLCTLPNTDRSQKGTQTHSWDPEVWVWGERTSHKWDAIIKKSLFLVPVSLVPASESWKMC